MRSRSLLQISSVVFLLCALACGGEVGDAPLVVCAEECSAGAVCVEGRCVGGVGPDEPLLSGEGNPSDGQSWTLLIYMIADNDLEQFSIVDLLEMMEVGSNDRFNIIVEVDRAEGYFATHPDVPIDDWTTAKRFRVERGELVELADLGEVNSGDPRVLSDFVTWGIQTYPADRVGLIMWDHGGGWVNFGGDTSHEHDTLTLAEIRQALDTSFAATGTKRLALLGFDACLMATYEVARLMRPYAHYMMASEELEPGIGWEYQALATLAAQPTASPEAFAQVMLPAYQDSCDQIKQGGDITLSMINLNKLGALDAALDRLVAEVRGASAIPALLRARGQALSFGKNANPAYDRDLVDVSDLVRQLAQLSPQLAGARDAVEAAMREALVSQVLGPAAKQASGLSIYLPSAATYYNAEYGSLGLGGQWPALLAEIAGVEIPVGARPTFTNPDHVAQIIEQDGQLGVVGQLSAETVGSVTEVRLYTALVVDEAAGQLLILSDSQGGLDVASGAAVGGWDQKLLVLRQGAKQSFGYLSTHVQGDYVVFMIPFGYAERAGQEQQIAFWTQVYDPAQGAVISSGFYGLSEGGTGQLTLAPGSVLSPLALVVDGGQASWSQLSDETFDANVAISSDLADVPAGAKIYMELNAKDAAGNLDYVYHVKNY